MEKPCTKCGVIRPLSQFQKRTASPDGLTWICKPCLKAYDAYRYQNDPKVKARHLRYQATPEGRLAGNRAKQAWRERNPAKRKIHSILNNAVLAGKIKKPKNCTICGAGGIIHGHHADYSKPLDVMWLCPNCHTNEHKADK